VSLSPVINPLHSNIFASFRKNLKWPEEVIHGHGETDFVKEKKVKISQKTLFKEHPIFNRTLYFVFYM
jgi:hypothetical protein